jgi:uncharacterized protein YjbJ (UPF0337 family)
MNKNQINGKVSAIKGQVKELVGKVIGNPTLEVKGKAQKLAGKTQEKIGDITQDIKKNSKFQLVINLIKGLLKCR